MSSTTPTIPPTPSNQLSPSPAENAFRNLSWASLIICPILIALPPRKLDIYTLGLLSATIVSTNHLTKTYTGTSMMQKFGTRMADMSGENLPPKALEIQKRLRAEKAERERRLKEGSAAKEGVILEEVRRKEEEEGEEGVKGLVQKAWYGQEGKDWKEKRDQREREALEEGRGYGDLIKDQIWEVWNWGKVKNEEVKEADEKVLEERRGKEGKEGKK